MGAAAAAARHTTGPSSRWVAEYIRIGETGEERRRESGIPCGQIMWWPPSFSLYEEGEEEEEED